jgi:hypothetical protein
MSFCGYLFDRNVVFQLFNSLSCINCQPWVEPKPFEKRVLLVADRGMYRESTLGTGNSGTARGFPGGLSSIAKGD